MRISRKLICSICALALLWLNAGTAAAQQVTVVRAARMLDVKTGRMVQNAVVVIEDGRIKSVGSGEIPEKAEILDLGNLTLLPGLIDMHVHLTGQLGPAPSLAEDALPFAVVAELDRLASTELWPGFDPRATPLALFDGERTLLFRHPNPPQEFAPLAGHTGVYAYAGRHGAMRANTSTLLGEVRTATLLLAPGRARSAAEWAATAIHETFHVFQRERHPTWSANEAELFVYPLEDAELLQWRRLETEALRRALTAEESGAAAAWAKTALDFRRARFARLPEGSVSYERGTELNEGLARYVQDRAAGKLTEAGFPGQGFAADQVRARGYATGRALGVLLDGLDPEWRVKLEQGDKRALDQLLAAALGERETDAAKFSPREREVARAQAGRDVDTLRQEKAGRREEFLARPGWKIVLTAAGQEPLWLQGFDPLNVHRVGEKEVLHTRFLKLGNSAGALEVLDGWSLTEGAGPHALFNGVRRLVVTGLAARPEVRETDGTLAVSGGSFTAEFRGAQAEWREQTLVVALP